MKTQTIQRTAAQPELTSHFLTQVLNSVGQAVVTPDLLGKITLQLLHKILDGLHPFMGILTPEGTLLYANRAFLQIAMLQLEEVTGKPFEETYWWSHAEVSKDQLRAAIDQATAGKAFRCDTIVRGSDNRSITVDFMLAPIFDEAGQVSHLAFSGLDITTSKAAEQQVLQLNRTLERRVAERTAELERSNRELGWFASFVSHDLKAPLRTIDTLAHWIEEDAADLLPVHSRRHLTTLHGRVRRMDRLLTDLLAHARLTNQHYKTEQVDLRSLVEDVIDLLSPPPTFVVTIDEAMPVLQTQRSPLEMIVRNLISNAIKHHHRNDGHIHISATEVGALLEVSVSDDGPGIPPQFHKRIFEMFQTVQLRSQEEGSGMGLAIVQKLVENRGGAISLISEEGKGAKFEVKWPK